MAFNLSASLKSSFTTVSNSIKSTVNTVSTDFSKAANAFSSDISKATGLSSKTVNSALVGGAIGGLLDGGKGAALGALAGGFLGGGSANDLIGQVQNKLQGLISNSEELTGLLENPLKIVERGVADLAGLTGEEYGLVLEQYRVLSERTAYTDYVDNGYMNPYKGDDTAASRIPNPLRNHNGYNYKITLGVLDPKEYNNPEAYRSAGGFKNYVIQSSGGNLNKRYQVFDETGGGKSEHAEYYIDNLDLDAVLAPNPNTRVTLGTSLSFTVTEPYSMGNFIQAIIGAAATAGYSSHMSAPFCLRIDFVGWNLDGSTNANFLQRPIFLPIKITNIEFSVTGQGSTYEVKAVPMSESGLADNVDAIKTSIRATGVLLHQVLETNDNSVTSAVNRQIQDLEETGALAPYDRYIIAFPKTRTALVDALQAGNVDESAFTVSTEQREAERTGNRPDDGLRGSHASQSSLESIVIRQSSRTYAVLKSFAENTNLMNEIGLSPINEDTNAPGNTQEVSAAGAINPDTGLVDTTSAAAQPATTARDHQFNQGQKITSIIERMVLQTRYAAERSTEGARNGLNKWFKIDTQVFIDDSEITEAQMGRKPKVYVYSVVPYEVDEAVTIASNAKPGNTAGLRAAAAKEYNYIYTGKNEDVLHFELKFNNAFLQTAYSNFGMNSGSRADANAGTTASTQTNHDAGAVAPPPADLQSNDDPNGETGFTHAMGESSGSASQDVRTRIAEMFHDRITNLTTDMITAEMEIMGDPFFIPQETGNYVAQQGSHPSATADGTMTYQQGQVFCVVNFKTPFDYQVKGATMESPQIVAGFSGLYSIWAVKNTFSGGQFKQTLKMIRRRGQLDPATTGTNGFVQVDNNADIANKTTQSDGTVGQSGTPNVDCAPISGADDIRNLMPAVAKDVADQLAAPVKQIESQLNQVALDFKQAVEGVDFGLAKAPDLSKVIPRIASGAAGALIGNAIGGRAGTAIGGALGVALSDPGVVSGINDLTTQASDALTKASTAVNTAANEGVAALTRAANTNKWTVG